MDERHRHSSINFAHDRKWDQSKVENFFSAFLSYSSKHRKSLEKLFNTALQLWKSQKTTTILWYKRRTKQNQTLLKLYIRGGAESTLQPLKPVKVLLKLWIRFAVCSRTEIPNNFSSCTGLQAFKSFFGPRFGVLVSHALIGFIMKWNFWDILHKYYCTVKVVST